ncbi:hypothetical protein LIER_26216 [Lithospermum erythrorhizon]|uniref:Uncharacterized protein n=1 Tax=Lithospermum erythrorhizon TaxID=34254 RepID=A0AAV3R9M3_LITER
MIGGILLAQKPDLLQPEDGVGVDVKPLMISEKLMKGKRVMDVPLNLQDAPEPEPTLAPESEAAAILIKKPVPPVVTAETAATGPSDADHFMDVEEGYDEDPTVKGARD